MDILASYLIIFLARIGDVTLGTVRTLLVIRGRRALAAMTGFFEVGIYITVLGQVMSNMRDPFKIVAYALGFATGTYVGMLVEERLAIGTLIMQIIPGAESQALSLAAAARERGYGVTIIPGEGREGPRHLLMVTLHRRAQAGLLSLVDELAPGSFITALDARSATGGVFAYRKGK